MTDAAAIAKLRAIAAALRGHELGAWFAAALGEYEAGARHGATLEAAFGVVPGWWRLEAIERRDELLRELRRTCFPGHSIRAAAKKIAAALEHYEASAAWRQDRPLVQPVQDDRLRHGLHAILKTGAPCGRTTIRNALLANGDPLSVGHEACDSAPTVLEVECEQQRS